MREGLHAPARGCLLATVEFAQINNVALKNPLTPDAAISDNAPAGMFFVILATFLTAQKQG
jgi:hypothetical protein